MSLVYLQTFVFTSRIVKLVNDPLKNLYIIANSISREDGQFTYTYYIKNVTHKPFNLLKAKKFFKENGISQKWLRSAYREYKQELKKR